MASTIKLKNGSGAPLAADLVTAEPALDLTNKRLYTEDSGGTVIEVGTNPTELQVDNINIDGNAITSTDTNGNIAITPDGTGEVDISKVDIDSGTIDNTVIGGTTTAAGSFTTLQADTSLNVDGTVTADGLTVDGDVDINATNTTLTSGQPRIWLIENDETDLSALIRNISGDLQINTVPNDKSGATLRFNLDHSTGDISFYEDTGNTAKFFWDASAEQLALGTAFSSVTPFTINTSVGSGGAIAYFKATGANDNGLVINVDDPGVFLSDWRIAETSVMRLDDSGNLGIGTDSPAQALHLNTSGSDILARFQSSAGYTDVGMDSGPFVINTTSSSGYRIRNSGTDAVMIDSSGNVGIGTTSPNGVLELNESSSVVATSKTQTGYPNLIIKDTSGSYADEMGGAISFEGVYGALAKIAGVKQNGANSGSFRDFGELVFYTHGNGSEDNYAALNEAARFTSGGNLAFPNGQGIDFSASEGGGASSSILDDYEEGTWTVGIRDGNGNVGSQTGGSGLYTRIGNVVYFRGIAININTSGLTSGSSIFITGLPFTANQFIPCTARVDNVTFTGYVTGQTVQNDTAVQFTQNISGTNDTTVKVSELSSGNADIDISGFYYTDS